MSVENNICEAIDILIDHAVSQLQFDKTILGTVTSCIDEGQGLYRIKYQDSTFTAFAQGSEKYKNDTKVYVTIPSNDVTRDRIILGTLSKLGTAYTTAASAEDRLSKVGGNLITKDAAVQLCSYDGYTSITYSGNQLKTILGISQDDIEMYKQGAEDIMIAANFQTAFPEEQASGNGDFGIILECSYYVDETKETYTRTYILNVNNMLGQPYHMVIPTRQYGLFEVDVEELVSIDSFTVYCRNFPKLRSGEPKDITVSDFEIYFMRQLSEDELAGASLRIITPLGSYFRDTDNTKRLQAEIKVKGNVISDSELSNVEFYWFIRDVSVTYESEYYSPYAGTGWKCLNKRLTDSIALETDEDVDLVEFVAAAAFKDLNPEDCISYENAFKCIAVMEDVTLYDTVKIYNNQSSARRLVISSNYPTSFSFETAYKFTLTAKLYNADEQEVVGDYYYYWGYEADGKELIDFDEGYYPIIETDPNFAQNIITYVCTVYNENDIYQGSASITFSNSRVQKQYTVVLNNATRVFKYNAEGVSPTSQSTEKKDRITLSPIGFEVYDREGKVVISDDVDKITLFNMRWLWPVEHTMLETTYPVDSLDQVDYNGILCYTMPIVSTEQLQFIYTIANKFNIANINNTVILEVRYQGLIMVGQSNFTFTKDGELGTNGTKYVVTIEPKTLDHIPEQVYIQNGSWRYWSQDDDGQIKTYSISGNMSFIAKLWDGNPTPLLDSASGTTTWSIVQGSDNIQINNGQVSVKNGATQNQAIVIQGCFSSDQYSNLAHNYYGTYVIPIMRVNNSTYTYVITGGFNHAIYEADGSREGFTSAEPFHIYKIRVGTNTLVAINSVTWKPSWETTTYTGIEPKKDSADTVGILPPKQIGSMKNNYILINVDDDAIVWSVHFYFNRYSMAAMNEWDGTGIEVNADRSRILAPQIAAGTKDGNNTFSGIAIGKTFAVSGSSKNEIGLFGYKDGVRTIFLDSDTGAATFGIPNTDGGCLQITPSSKSVNVGTYGATKPSWNSTNEELTGGSGGALQFTTNGSNQYYLYFGNGFLVDKSGAYITGTIRADKGKIGGWTLNSNSLTGTSGDNKITLNASTPSITSTNGSHTVTIDASAPSITGKNGSTTVWQLRANDNGDGRFSVGKVGDDNSSWIQFNSSGLSMRGSIKGTNWYINQGGTFKFGSSNYVSCNGSTLTISGGNIDGTGWYIYKNGNFKFGDDSRNIRYGGSALQITGGDLTGDSWYINKDGSFSFANGKVSGNSSSVTLKNIDLSGTGWEIKQGGSFKFANGKIEGNSSSLTIKDTDLSGTGWYINSGGNFKFGGANNSIEYNGSELKIAMGNLSGFKWHINSNGDVKFGDGNFTVDTSGNVKITGDIGNGDSWYIHKAGDVKLGRGNFTVDTSGNVSISGTVSAGDGSTLSLGGGKFSVNRNGDLTTTGEIFFNRTLPNNNIGSRIYLDSSKNYSLALGHASVLYKNKQYDSSYLGFFANNSYTPVFAIGPGGRTFALKRYTNWVNFIRNSDKDDPD